MRVTSWIVAAFAMVCLACQGNEGGKTVAGEGTHGKPAQTAGEVGVHPAQVQVAGKNGGNGKQGRDGVRPAPKATLASVTP